MDGEIFDGLIYPSVATRGNFDNLALKTEYANKHLKFIKAEYVLIKNKSTITGGNQYDCKKIDVADGFDKHGYINWAKDNCVLQDPSGKRIMIIGRDKDGIVKRVYEGPYREEK
jgi:hypothetical protein